MLQLELTISIRDRSQANLSHSDSCIGAPIVECDLSRVNLDGVWVGGCNLDSNLRSLMFTLERLAQTYTVKVGQVAMDQYHVLL